MGAHDLLMMLTLQCHGDMRVLSQRGECGVEARLPTRVVAPLLFAPRHMLGVEAHGNIVDEEPAVDAGGVNRPRGTGQDDLTRPTPDQRDVEISGEMIVRSDGNHTEDCVGVWKRLDEGADRVATSCGVS